MIVGSRGHILLKHGHVYLDCRSSLKETEAGFMRSDQNDFVK